MKRFLSLLLLACILIGSVVVAEGFDASQYSDDELRSIIDVSRQQLSLNNLSEKERVVFDDDNVTIIYTGYENEPTSDYSQLYINFKCINKSEDKVAIIFEDGSINSYMVNSLVYWVISSNKILIDKMDFLHDDLKNIDYQDLENIEVNFNILLLDEKDDIKEHYYTDNINIDL